MPDYKVLITDEYYKISRDKPTIGLLLMVKNEHQRIHVTLNSMVGKDGSKHVDAFIVFDTGSTDNTIDIIREFCQKHKINLYLSQGTFEDFSTSRNVSLDFADTIDVHYALLLDCNDELQGGEKLRTYAKEVFDKPNTCFLVCQQWWSNQLDKYYNLRFLKVRNGWRYRGSVHEWLKDTTVDGTEPRHPILRMSDEIVLYQDRTKDDDKSAKRFARDRELLLRDYKKDPKEPRTLFYLAQTCQCLNLNDEALYYSKLRLEETGFIEERFHSFMRCAACSLALGHDWYDAIRWYLRAYEEFYRAEPLVKIADFYRFRATEEVKAKRTAYPYWRAAYMYIREACEIPYPDHCILFVDRGIYDYYRWHVMSFIAYSMGHYAEGKAACLKALQHDPPKAEDQRNLEEYLKLEKNGPLCDLPAGNVYGVLPGGVAITPQTRPVEPVGQPTVSQPGVIQPNNVAVNATANGATGKETRKQFLDRKIKELRSAQPNARPEQLERRANEIWKLQRKRK